MVTLMHMPRTPRKILSFQIESATKRRMISRKSSGDKNGWTPISYPDPRIDYEECRIANARDHHHHEDKDMGSKLLLCDPDGILNFDGISMLADKMRAFDEKHTDSEKELSEEPSFDDPPRPVIAIAMTTRMDISDIIHDFAFYTFEDEEDMVNDAAMYFANYLHREWFSEDKDDGGTAHKYKRSGFRQDEELKGNVNAANEARAANGILIFISIKDNICFISSGNGISAVLPWWRLEKVEYSMNDNMRTGHYFDALVGAIADMTMMLDEGPPTPSEKVADFLTRFGVFLLFSVITFFMALNGEYRDRQLRYEDAELVSEMDSVERIKARRKLKSYNELSCPICLEPFMSNENESEGEGDRGGEDGSDRKSRQKMPRVDSFGIPICGSDKKILKILRCGHAFDETCWRIWISSEACTDPFLCPVCRTDIAHSREDRPADENGGELSRSVPTIQYGTFDESPSIRPDDENSEDSSIVDFGWPIVRR